MSSTFGTDSAVRNWARQVQQKLKMLGEIWKSYFCYWCRTQRKCEYKTNYCRNIINNLTYNGIWWDIDDDKTQRLRSHYFQTDPSGKCFGVLQQPNLGQKPWRFIDDKTWRCNSSNVGIQLRIDVNKPCYSQDGLTGYLTWRKDAPRGADDSAMIPQEMVKYHSCRCLT